MPHIVVLSYRDDYNHTCGRSCGCVRGSGESSFEMNCFETEPGAANWIVSRICQDREAEYLHYVFDSWASVVSTAMSGSDSWPSSDEHSIRLSLLDYEYMPEGTSNEDFQSAVEQKNDLIDRIVALVRNKLQAHKDEEVLQQQRAEKAAKDAEEAAKTAREKAEYDRLKQKFGGLDV